MVQHVWEAASRVKEFSRVLVATDSEAVAAEVRAFGGEAIMTGSHYTTGSERIAEVAKSLTAEIVVNVQGDEPLISPDAVSGLVRMLQLNPELGIATLAVLDNDSDKLTDPNVVKLVMNEQNRAIYFSRAPIMTTAEGAFYKHIGIYAYRRDVLLKLTALAPSPLEKAEQLEQLRALEQGIAIGVVVTDQDTVAVDVPSDIGRVEAELARRKQV